MPSVESNALDRVILSWPKNLTDVSEVKPNGPRRSWIQLAHIGVFHSKRYGKFEISKGDLKAMEVNFAEVFPKAPTELPIDYDHLSMDPKKPGDGIAAGWMKKVELRADGTELWAEVEWTEDGAARIEKKEYRFVSPSFVKNHTHKDGKQIGTTLLAAAITNHPFLEGMKALTLYNFSALGDLALNEASESAVLHLAEIGQRVSFKLDAEVTPELTPEERAQSFRVKATIGQGDDQFVRLTTIDNKEFGWFRVNQFRPADAPEKTEENSMSTNTAVKMSATDELISLANAIASEHPDMSLAEAYIEAGHRRVDLAEARRAEIGIVADESPADAPVLSLSRTLGETFDALCLRYAAEKHISLREAIPIVSAAHPKLAEAYGRGEAVA